MDNCLYLLLANSLQHKDLVHNLNRYMLGEALLLETTGSDTSAYILICATVLASASFACCAYRSTIDPCVDLKHT